MIRAKQTQVIIKGRLPGENVDLFYRLIGELPTKANISKQKLLFGAIDTAEQRGYEKARKELKTRQSKLQMRYHKQGKCQICGGKLSSSNKWLCEKHRIMKNEAAKRRRLKN